MPIKYLFPVKKEKIMIHIFNKPLGLGNMYENRKMYASESEHPANPFNDPCLKNIPTDHPDKCLVLTNSFGNGCLEPMDVGDIRLPNVIYCEDINTVRYYVPKLKQGKVEETEG